MGLLLFAAGTAAAADGLAGTGDGATAPAATNASATVILDASSARRIREQTQLVPDPFGSTNLVIRSTQAHHDEQKIFFVRGDGLFALPANPANASLDLRLAAQGPTGIRIVLATTNGSATHRATLPATGQWCHVSVPLAPLADRLGRGAPVIDLTLFQKDESHQGNFFLERATLQSSSR